MVPKQQRGQMKELQVGAWLPGVGLGRAQSVWKCSEVVSERLPGLMCQGASNRRSKASLLPAAARSLCNGWLFLIICKC